MEDQKIVQLYWDRNEQAIPETSTKYGAYCASIAKNILGSTEDAEECVNDTYLNAWTDCARTCATTFWKGDLPYEED